MAATNTVKLLEHCRVSPPIGSVTESTLQLTYFDAIFLQRPNIRRLFFYELRQPDITTTHFLTTLLPKLKHSLSLALHLFYPLAGNLTHSPEIDEPVIRYVEGDSVSLTVVESDADFYQLTSNEPREVSELHHLLPQLHPPSLLSLQVTVFSDSGISIGYNVCHVAADGSTLTHFMKSWASISKNGNSASVTSLPFYDRNVSANLHTLNHLKKKAIQKVKEASDSKQTSSSVPLPTGIVRATFLLSRADIERLSRRAPPGCSPFVLTCAHAWACVVRAEGDGEGEETVPFLCPVNLRGRLDRSLPYTYFGNCLGACFPEIKRSELANVNGLMAAAAAIQTAIRKYLDGGVLEDVEKWESRLSPGLVAVGGSPKFRVYDTDFGWGRPKKTEVLSSRRRGTIYVGDSREEEAGIEVGLTLPEDEMHRFAALFVKGLEIRS